MDNGNQNYFEIERKRMSQQAEKRILLAWVLNIVVLAFLYFAMGPEELRNSEVLTYLYLLEGLMVLMTVIRIPLNRRRVNFVVHGNQGTKEEAMRIINSEMAQGNGLVEEYIYEFTGNKTPYGDKIVLVPSYLLLCKNGRFTAIPVGQVYWICAQVGRKGQSSYIVKLTVFTKEKIYDLIGTDVAHVEQIAARMYQYIPNIFSDYDPFVLSYMLEEMFKKDHDKFVSTFEQQDQQCT